MQHKTIIGYTLKHLLGAGGMAEVWYAENSIGKKAAVKILKEEFTKMETVLERFKNEAQVMVALVHPHIRQVYDYGTIDGRPCIVMEYLEGADLSDRLKRGEHFSDAQLTRWWNNMVDILQYTHQQGVIHRDIKPSNIFITDTGELRLLDFGIAKIKSSITLTQTGNRMGTLMYMSPEQVRDSKNLDYRSDIYSLAVTFYHLVSGKAPYDSQTDSEFDIQMKIVAEVLDVTILPVKWRQLLAPLLIKEVEHRGCLVKLGESDISNQEETIIESKLTQELLPPRTSEKKGRKKILLWGMGFAILLLIMGWLAILQSGTTNRWYLSDKMGENTEFVDSIPDTATLKPVELNGKWGFFDKDGREVIPLKYDGAESFSEGLARVKLNGKYGFVDKDGREVIPLKYDYAWSFSEGLAYVELNGKYGFVDKDGREVVPLKYDDVFSFSEGLARVKLNGEWGFVDKDGREVVPLKYDDVFSFSEGLARVKLNGEWGFVDKDGREVVPLKYDDVFSFSEGLARVKLNGEWGFVDKDGREVVPLKYDDAYCFSEGLAEVKLNGKYGFVDKDGREVIPLKYDYAWSFSEGLAYVELNGKYGFVDKDGREVIPLKYDGAESFSEGLARVKLNGKYGFVDKDGREVIPLKYDYAWSFSEGLAYVKLNGKYGFVDKDGREVIPLKYDRAWSFSEGLAKVMIDDYEFYIDKEGYCVYGNAPAGHPRK
ncbi:WG repeat-containing protein [Capnocytophaga canis]|uniref:WG repeat-containing protein n=1 Tax=Capnocytophaga canis TaxID=1848903 RepID=UPI00370D8222